MFIKREFRKNLLKKISWKNLPDDVFEESWVCVWLTDWGGTWKRRWDKSERRDQKPTVLGGLTSLS